MAFSGTGFSLWAFVQARATPHRLKPVPQRQTDSRAIFQKHFRKRELVVFAPVIRTAATGMRCAVRQRLPGFLADRDCVLRRWIMRRGLLLQCFGRLNGFFCLGLRMGYL